MRLVVPSGRPQTTEGVREIFSAGVSGFSGQGRWHDAASEEKTMARRPRRNHSPAFKAKVAVAAIVHIRQARDAVALQVRRDQKMIRGIVFPDVKCSAELSGAGGTAAGHKGNCPMAAAYGA